MNKKFKYFLISVLTIAISLIAIRNIHSYVVNKKGMEKGNKYQRAYFGDSLS